MELDNVIVGTKLSEIQKKPDEVKLVFENSKTNKGYVLTFKGFLLETSGSALNKRVKNIQLNNTLGFRAISQLRYLNRDLANYRQLFIQMEGSDDNNKLELFGVLRSYKMLPTHKTAVSNNPINRKNAVKKTLTGHRVSVRH